MDTSILKYPSDAKGWGGGGGGGGEAKGRYGSTKCIGDCSIQHEIPDS